MENRHVSYMIFGISLVMVIIIFIFQSALKDIVNASCSEAHGTATSCPMFTTINDQTYLALIIVAVLVVIGIILFFSKPKERLIIKKIKERIEVKRNPIDHTKLDKEERIIAKLLEASEGGMFQSDLVEKSGFGKVKVTRILDKLQGKQIVERKRRGMNNFVILK